LLAFFVTLSPEKRKVLEDENKKQRWSLNVKTGKMELVSKNAASKRQRVESENPKTGVTEVVSRSVAYMRQRVDSENPKTGVTEEVPRSTARGRQLVDWENPETGVTEKVPRSTANDRQLVDWENPVTGVTEEVPRSTAYNRQLVLFQDQYIRRSSKQTIINREKKGKRCPCGDKCPSCDIQTSELWITLRKAKEHFVQTGDKCGIELKDEDVVDYWCKIAPKLSETMFQANGANGRVVCKYCFRSAIRRFAEELGQTTIFVPQ
jgi:hypothetical protein